MKILLLTIVAVLTLSACNTTIITKFQKIQKNTKHPKNIIMVVANGMGPSYTEAYRYYSDNPQTQEIETTIFDRTLVGTASIYTTNLSGLVTDSAAAATALSSAVKSYNGAIAVDNNKKPVQTVLEFAKQQGKKTGVVVTSKINHATPAAYLTHNDNRKNYNQIADSYVDSGIKADVYFGGGWRYFIREDRHLINEFISAGFAYIDSYEQLTTIKSQSPIIGLFADSTLPWSIDDSNQYRLSLMTKTAIQQLENEQGYFLLVEASLIDWASHSNDITAAMSEMSDFDITMQYLQHYVKYNPDTLVVLTAGRSTGKLSIDASGDDKWQPKFIRDMARSPHHIAQILSTENITQTLASSLFNFDITQGETQYLQNVKYSVLARLAQAKKTGETSNQPNIQNALYSEINQLIDQRTNTAWTISEQTTMNVPVHALGSHKEAFNGSLNNTDIAQSIFKLLGKKN